MTPSLFSTEWFSALGAIILIDLVLAGDNALVIGLAARNVPLEMQRRVVLWGTLGAIAIRAALTMVVVYLLQDSRLSRRRRRRAHLHRMEAYPGQ